MRGSKLVVLSLSDTLLTDSLAPPQLQYIVIYSMQHGVLGSEISNALWRSTVSGENSGFGG